MRYRYPEPLPPPAPPPAPPKPKMRQRLDRCYVRRDGKLLPSHVFQVPPGAVISTIDVYWSPDGRRIAWLFQGKSAPPSTKPADPDAAPKLTGFGELVIDRTIGPRIEIAGDRSLGPEAFDPDSHFFISSRVTSLARTALLNPAREAYRTPSWLWMVICVEACLSRSGTSDLASAATPRSCSRTASVPIS